MWPHCYRVAAVVMRMGPLDRARARRELPRKDARTSAPGKSTFLSSALPLPVSASWGSSYPLSKKEAQSSC